MTEQQKRTVLAIGAHPDDVEILSAGLLALLKEKGWHVEIATMTPGDCGSAELGRKEIGEIRKKEAAASAEILEANYHCLEQDDVFIMYDRPTLLDMIKLVRQVGPGIVVTHSPQDYMVDHETTSQLVRTACFSAGIKNIETDGIQPFMKIPHLYYMDPIEGKDILGNGIQPTTVIDISRVMETKERMLKTHESQRSWLMSHHKIDEYIAAMKRFSAERGQEIGVEYAEGYRQHMGSAYPQNNILQEELTSLVHIPHF